MAGARSPVGGPPTFTNVPVLAYQVPLGAAGEAAVYTEHFHELSLLRKILLRMRSWQNYAFFEAG
jgi:hypothetical protein